MDRLCESPVSSLSSKSNRILSGLFAEFDTLNQNERIYPKEVYESALLKIQPKIKEGRLLGECDHPDYDEVKLANVSHVIRECVVRDNKVYGTVELLDTPAGKIAQCLVEAGIPLGVSSRALGNTRRIKEGTEVTDLNIITYDLVADPSFKGAILTESIKTKLKNQLDSIEKTLPLNEAAGENTSIRNKINDIKESLDKSPTMFDTLIESIGDLTIKKQEIEENLLIESKRNKSLRSNMMKLQENYNSLKQNEEVLSKTITKTKSYYKNKISMLKESYEKEIINLRKELAIEKRGLSSETIMPLLEGLTSQEDIENKLNSVKHLGTRRYSISNKEIETLTEGFKSTKGSRLSNIISSV